MVLHQLQDLDRQPQTLGNRPLAVAQHPLVAFALQPLAGGGQFVQQPHAVAQQRPQQRSLSAHIAVHARWLAKQQRHRHVDRRSEGCGGKPAADPANTHHVRHREVACARVERLQAGHAIALGPSLRLTLDHRAQSLGWDRQQRDAGARHHQVLGTVGARLHRQLVRIDQDGARHRGQRFAQRAQRGSDLDLADRGDEHRRNVGGGVARRPLFQEIPAGGDLYRPHPGGRPRQDRQLHRHAHPSSMVSLASSTATSQMAIISSSGR